MDKNANPDMRDAQDKFIRKHGKDSLDYLESVVDTVVECAPLDGWLEVFFYGGAVALYNGLAEVDQISVDVIGGILERHPDHRAGSLGWEMIRHWQVAVILWKKGHVHRKGQNNTAAYEAALREFVQSELKRYYFGHWEHSRDIEHFVDIPGVEKGSIDGHGVAAFFRAEANIEDVQDIFGGISESPGVMSLETYRSACYTAYGAAKEAGHGDSLRAFNGVADAIEQGAPHGVPLTDDYQRRLDPADNSNQYNQATNVSFGDGDTSSLGITLEDGRTIVITSIGNVQMDGNMLGISLSNEQVDMLVTQVRKSDAGTIRKAVEQWVPISWRGFDLLVKILEITNFPPP